MMPAIAIYRDTLSCVRHHREAAGDARVNIVAADTDEEARFLATSGRQSFANLRRGMPTTLPPPNREFEKEVTPFRATPLQEVQSVSIVGSARTVRDDVADLVARTQADELIVGLAHLRSLGAARRSYELVAQVVWDRCPRLIDTPARSSDRTA